MLRLNLKKEPYWLELPANVKVRVRPLSTAIMSAAQSSVIQQMNILRQTPISILPEGEDENIRQGLMESLLIQALARGAILEWQGVLNSEGTTEAEPTDQNIQDLMDIWFMAQEFWKHYSSELSLLEAEGNASGPAANGTSAGAQAIAKDAVKQDSPAAEEKKAKSPENSAPISRTNLSHKKVLKPGMYSSAVLGT